MKTEERKWEKVVRKKERVVRRIQESGDLVHGATVYQIAENAAVLLGIRDRYDKGIWARDLTNSECHHIFDAVLREISKRKKIRLGILPKQGKKRAREAGIDVQAFYRSFPWRKLRLEIIKKHGRRCLCCGATPEDGIKIHVDHIKPLRFNWNLRLDPNNLQVLCEICNHGKGNWDKTDWRAS